MNAIVNFRLCTLSDSELLEKVDTLTDAMYESQKVPPRYIPARPNEDYDLLIGEIIKRFYLMTQDQNAQASVATGDATENKEPATKESQCLHLAMREGKNNTLYCTSCGSTISTESPDNTPSPVERWDDNKVIEFVNWYLKLNGLDERHELENQHIVDSFQKGDDYKLWWAMATNPPLPRLEQGITMKC